MNDCFGTCQNRCLICLCNQVNHIAKSACQYHDDDCLWILSLNSFQTLRHKHVCRLSKVNNLLVVCLSNVKHTVCGVPLARKVECQFFFVVGMPEDFLDFDFKHKTERLLVIDTFFFLFSLNLNMFEQNHSKRPGAWHE